MIGVARKLSLETEVALEVEGRDDIAPVLSGWEVEAAETELNTGSFVGLSEDFRFRAMIVVSSALNFSRSPSATGLGEMKVKLWPLSSPKRAIFSFTWDAPSLLQNNAVPKLNHWNFDRKGVVVHEVSACGTRTEGAFWPF